MSFLRFIVTVFILAALGSADFGVISSARPARTVQLGARLSF